MRRVLVAAAPAYLLGSALIVGVLVLGALVGLKEIQGAGATYSVAATRRCLEDQGVEVRVRPPITPRAYATLAVGPFQSVTNEPSAVLRFAPTAEIAQDAEWSDSERIYREGNVLIPAGADNPIVHNCLTQE